MTNSSERVKAFRERQRKQGRLKREFYLNNEEWLSVKQRIKELRLKRNE